MQVHLQAAPYTSEAQATKASKRARDTQKWNPSQQKPFKEFPLNAFCKLCHHCATHKWAQKAFKCLLNLLLDCAVMMAAARLPKPFKRNPLMTFAGLDFTHAQHSLQKPFKGNTFPLNGFFARHIMNLTNHKWICWTGRFVEGCGSWSVILYEPQTFPKLIFLVCTHPYCTVPYF